MNPALLCYHRNAHQLYKPEWLDQYRLSIEAQTVEVDIFELDYGGGDTQLLPESEWASADLPTHVHAQNALLDRIFGLGYAVALNSNADDIFDPGFAAVSQRSIADGAQVASSNFRLINPDGATFHVHDDLHGVDLREQLRLGQNPLCHPTVAYTAEFWAGCSRYRPDEIPHEDLSLWQREIDRFKFVVAPEILVSHRVHDQSVCAQWAAEHPAPPAALRPATKRSRSRTL